MSLFEKYRPKTWAEVVGQDKALETIRRVAQRGLAGRAYWISGKSGTGKTTIARLIAQDVADPFFTQEIDASRLTPAALAEIEADMQQFGWGRGGRAYIVNEAHGLRRDTVRQLLVLLERLPAHVVMIFTTTIDGQATFEGMDDASPLLSRCIEIKLAQRGLAEPFAARAREIADAEGLNGKPMSAYLELVKQSRNNMRTVLQAIESGHMA